MKWQNPTTTTKSVLGLLVLGTLLTSSLASVLLAQSATAQTPTSVSIHNNAFEPAVVTVVIGVNNTVTWTNNDPVTHTVTADDNSFSNTLSPGGTYTRIFTTAGTFTYHCAIHTYMTGTVKVLGPSGTSSSGSPGSSGGIPEFPFQSLAVVAVTAIVLASYVAVRKSRRT